jgi:hypothetical protein
MDNLFTSGSATNSIRSQKYFKSQSNSECLEAKDSLESATESAIESAKELQKKRVSIRDVAELARRKQSSDGIGLADRIRLEAIHQQALGSGAAPNRAYTKVYESYGLARSSPNMINESDSRKFNFNPRKVSNISESNQFSSRTRSPASTTLHHLSSRTTSATARSQDHDFRQSKRRGRRSGIDQGERRRVSIPKFNNGGPDNLMQQLEANSWARQMKAYLDSGDISPIRAKEILACSYLRLSDSNLDTLRDILDEVGEGHLVDFSPHSKKIGYFDFLDEKTM